jgi:hypothetical protein
MIIRFIYTLNYSKNVISADNQQESLDAEWIVGFVDGEGCFHVAINRQYKMKIGWQVLPEFRIVQHKRDIDILHKIQKTLGIGQVTRNHGDRFEVRVRGIQNLKKLINFFYKHNLQTTKKENFELFCQIIDLMENKEHLTQEGLNKIALLASSMNNRVKSKYLESSETICRTSDHINQTKI